MYTGGMNKRQGYSVLGWDLPTVLKKRLEAEAEAEMMSAAALLTRILRERYNVPREELPSRPKKVEETPKPKKPRGGKK